MSFSTNRMIAAGIGALLWAAAPAAPALAQQDTTAPQDSPAAQDSMLGMLTMKPGSEMSEADRGYMKAMQTMQQTLMKTEMTGEANADFVRMMIPHHQSAIDMVDVLLQQEKVDPELKKMAEKMKADQTKEIEKMQKWLDAHAK